MHAVLVGPHLICVHDGCWVDGEVGMGKCTDGVSNADGGLQLLAAGQLRHLLAVFSAAGCACCRGGGSRGHVGGHPQQAVAPKNEVHPCMQQAIAPKNEVHACMQQAVAPKSEVRQVSGLNGWEKPSPHPHPTPSALLSTRGLAYLLPTRMRSQLVSICGLAYLLAPGPVQPSVLRLVWKALKSRKKYTLRKVHLQFSTGLQARIIPPRLCINPPQKGFATAIQPELSAQDYSPPTYGLECMEVLLLALDKCRWHLDQLSACELHVHCRASQ